MMDSHAALLDGAFAALPETSILLLEADAEASSSVAMGAVSIMSKKGINIVVLSANKPCSNLLQYYAKNGIDTAKIFIACAICGTQGESPKDTGKVSHVQGGLVSLTEMSIALNNFFKQLKGKTVLFVDSISSLLIHNNPNAIARFIHAVLVSVQIKNMGAVLILAKDDSSKGIRSEIMQLCDKVAAV